MIQFLKQFIIFSSLLTCLPCFTLFSRPDGPETRVKTSAFILSDVSFILHIHNCKRQFTGVSVMKHLEVIVGQGLTELGSGNAQCRQVYFHAFRHILVVIDRCFLTSYIEVTVKRTGTVDLPDGAAV